MIASRVSHRRNLPYGYAVDSDSGAVVAAADEQAVLLRLLLWRE